MLKSGWARVGLMVLVVWLLACGAIVAQMARADSVIAERNRQAPKSHTDTSANPTVADVMGSVLDPALAQKMEEENEAMDYRSVTNDVERSRNDLKHLLWLLLGAPVALAISILAYRWIAAGFRP